MAPGVAKTFRKAYYRELAKYLHITKAMSMDDAESAGGPRFKRSCPGPVTLGNAGEYGEAVAAYLPRHQRENGFEEIIEEEARDAHRYAVEAATTSTNDRHLSGDGSPGAQSEPPCIPAQARRCRFLR